MLGSLHSSSSSSSHEDRSDDINNPTASSSSSRSLIISCADSISRGDFSAARRAATFLLSVSSTRGDAADRVAHQFARALSLRLDRCLGTTQIQPPTITSSPSSSAYLAFNQITPFLRFAHLTANQAILEAVEGARRVHIVDLDADTAHGLQWPPLLQAIAERADPNVGPPELRITGAGSDVDVLVRTADRLSAFARSLHLPFHFQPLLISSTSTSTSASASASASTGGTSFCGSSMTLELQQDETLAVNCVLFLHKLVKDGGEEELAAFLKRVKSMNPAVVTMAEREGSNIDNMLHARDDFPRRVASATDYYSAIFEALEATVPPNSRERMAVEQELLGKEIEIAVGSGVKWRGFDKWDLAMRAAGFGPSPLSPFAVSQARLLLRLHYPSEGYLVQEARGACFLGWQTRPLLSVSSWH